MFNLKRGGGSKTPGNGGGQVNKKRKLGFGNDSGSDEESGGSSEDEETKFKRLMKERSNQLSQQLDNQKVSFEDVETEDSKEIDQKQADHKPVSSSDQPQGSKYIHKLMQAKQKRDQDYKLIRQKELDKKAEKYDKDLVFETPDYQSQKYDHSTEPSLKPPGSEINSKENSKTITSQEHYKYDYDLIRVKQFIKTKLTTVDIESFKSRYFERMKSSQVLQ